MNKFSEINSLFARCTFIVKIHLDVDEDTGKYDVCVDVSEESYRSSYVRVLFRDVEGFRCELSLGGWSQIHMLGIREERPGFERPYVVREIEYDSLKFACSHASIMQG